MRMILSRFIAGVKDISDEKELQFTTDMINDNFSNYSAWHNRSSPGEGEHKIMSFIRLQRTCRGYNPNTSHVLYGLDADLIMLALATHEVHISILRENVFVKTNYQTRNSLMNVKSEADVVKCRGWFKDVTEQLSNLEISPISKEKSIVKKPYQFLHVSILRDYLKLDLKLPNMPEKFEPDFERLIDNFIFICFFAGNDFLPHIWMTQALNSDCISETFSAIRTVRSFGGEKRQMLMFLSQVLDYQKNGIKLGVFKSINESITRVAVYVSLLTLYILGGNKVKAVYTGVWRRHYIPAQERTSSTGSVVDKLGQLCVSNATTETISNFDLHSNSCEARGNL